MVATLPYNPFTTTNAQNTFNVDASGGMQGTALDSPNSRFNLAGGILATTETLPMWGGVAISENVPGLTGFPHSTLGGQIIRATNVTAATAGMITGFSVFDQNHAMLNWPGNPVPLSASGGQVNFYRLGSGARIWVAIAPTLVSLEGGVITQQVSWDFNAQQLVPYVAAYPANVITAASWAATNGGQATYTTTTAHGVAVGDYFTISGMTPAGYNGDFVAITGTTGSTLVAALATNPGAETALGTLVAGGGALAVKILEMNIGNSMTVNYSGGYATWNYAGSAAVILL